MAVYKYRMDDGTEVDVSLSMAALFKLQREAPELYRRYKEIFGKIGSGAVDELVMAEAIYMGYRAATQDPDPMSLEEFIGRMSDSRKELAETFGKLYGTEEKKQAFAPPSGRPHGKGRGRR